MSASSVVYCGLNARLAFTSLMQHFECPLSTTTSETTANQFSKGTTGVILKLKRGNPRTRYLDVSRFSVYPEEHERLFMGSSLQIVDIKIGIKSLKKYVSALRLFEQILNGHFLDESKKKARAVLLSFLHRVTEQSVVDELRTQRDRIRTAIFIDEHVYDTDAVLSDVENLDSSNILGTLDDDDHDGEAIICQLISETNGMTLYRFK